MTKQYRTKKDLAEGIPGIEDYKPHDRTALPLFFRMTSGTTRGAFTLLALHFPNAPQLRFYLRMFTQSLLLTHPKRCTAMQWAHLFFHTHAQSRILILDAVDLKDPDLPRLLTEFSPRHIYGFPALVLKLLTVLTAHTSSFAHYITSILLIGERLTTTLRHRLERGFPQSTIECAYASAEARVIGVPCQALMKTHPARAEAVFHPAPLADVHILERDSSGVGEIAVHTPEFGYYRTGDAGTLVEEMCACGAKSTLTVLGRLSNDIIHCLGATFHILEVERVFSQLRTYVEDFYLEIAEQSNEKSTQGVVHMVLIPTETLRRERLPERFVSNYISTNLQVTKTRTLGDLIDTKLFLPLRITFVTHIDHPGKRVPMRKIDTPPTIDA